MKLAGQGPLAHFIAGLFAVLIGSLIGLEFSPMASGQTKSDSAISRSTTNKESTTSPQITSTIPSTPAISLRSPTTTNTAVRDFTSYKTSAGWTEQYIVLVEGSTTQPIGLTAKNLPAANPATDIRWQVIRNPSDAVGLHTAPLPTNDLSISTAVGPNTSLSLNAVGSFSIVAYVDSGTHVYAPGNPAVFYNIVVCRVTVPTGGDTSAAHPAKIVYDYPHRFYYLDDAPILAGGDFFSVNYGTFASFANAGVAFNSEVIVIGGGGDGRLGTDLVFLGWSNNVSVLSMLGTYQNNHSTSNFFPNVDLTFKSDLDFITTAALPIVKYPSMDPTLSATHPLLDSSRLLAGTGGDSICLSTPDSLEISPRTNLTLGVHCQVASFDSPGMSAIGYHPLGGPSEIQTFVTNFNATARLVCWTQSKTGGGAGGSLYGCISERPWSCEGTYSVFDWTKPADQCHKNGQNITMDAPTAHAHAVPLETCSHEILRPVVTDRYSIMGASQ